MAEKTISGIKPTRMELLKLRRREALARKGHDLLEEKRDALVLELFRLLENYAEARRRMLSALDRAYEDLVRARITAGEEALSEIAYAAPQILPVDAKIKKVMGVSIPDLDVPSRMRRGSRGYTPATVPAEVDEAIDAFDLALREILEYAELETSIILLSEAIEMTKRRVNALEHVQIPRIQATERRIASYLQELEREDFFRRKCMKRILAERELEEPAPGNQER
ncbi:MAG: V-type ATP synthase subunit D [Methanoculleaceae archaeon]